MDKFITTLDSFSLETSSDEATRYAVKEAARRLLVRMQTPFERAWDLVMESPGILAVLQTCIDIGIFEKWANVSAHEASLEELLALCSKECEENLLRMIWRCKPTIVWRIYN